MYRRCVQNVKNLSAEKASEKESTRLQKENADFFGQKGNRKKKTERQKEAVSIKHDACFVTTMSIFAFCMV